MMILMMYPSHPSDKTKPIHSAISRFVISHSPYTHNFCFNIRTKLFRRPIDLSPTFQLRFKVEYPTRPIVNLQLASGLYGLRLVLQGSFADHYVFNYPTWGHSEVPNRTEKHLLLRLHQARCRRTIPLPWRHLKTPAVHLAI